MGKEHDEKQKMYSEEILDHYEAPRNFGKPAKFDSTWQEANPLCGDIVTFYLTINKGMISDIRFTGKGCAISTASASMITEYLKGKPAQEIVNMNRETVLKLLGVDISPARLKCALVAMYGVKKAHVIYEQQNK